jgi:hypothetical protein
MVTAGVEQEGQERHLGTLFVGIKGYNVLESFTSAGRFYAGKQDPVGWNTHTLGACQ